MQLDAVPKPVKCVSIASPYVGDENYRKAFKLAEEMNFIQHLRVSNHKDIVTIGPFVSLRLRFWKNKPSVGHLFKHVGYNLKLFKEGKKKQYELSYPEDSVGDELSRAWNQCIVNNLCLSYLENHGCAEYVERMEMSEEELSKLSLNEIYETKIN